jgi:hypothetical protein
VVAIRGLDGSGIPDGLQIVPSDDNSTLRVTVAQSTPPGDVTLQYRVADATNDPDRYVWGTITVSVQDRPEAIANLSVSGFADRAITLRWNAGGSNNSPITNYRVTSTAGSTVTVTDCAGTTCTIPTSGNGPNNSVSVAVTAINAIGESDPVTLPDRVWSDVIPPAPAVPTATPLDHGLRISWNQVSTPSGGSAVDRYRVTVGGYSGDVSPSVCADGVCTWDTTSVGLSLDNGVAASFTVSPRNAAYTALSVWNTSEPGSGVPAGAPIAQQSPLATTVDDTTVQLDWAGVFSDNGKAITEFTAAAFTGGAPTCAADGTISANGASLSAVGTGLSTQFGLSVNTTYSLMVFAFNGQGCTASAAVVAHTPPAVVSGLTFELVQNGSNWDVAITGGSIGGDELTGDYSIIYQLSGGSTQGGEQPAVGLGTPLTADGTQYGQPLSVQARVCRSYDSAPVCQSALSQPFSTGYVPVNPSISNLTFTPNGLLGGNFDWLGWPSGSGYENVQYTCTGQSEFVNSTAPAPGHCEASGLLGVTLTIRVTANGGQTYDITYPGT